ncbi:MAG TPA: HlyD family secretion protein [Candidatus Eisenbacteria bacterium]|nr:HlyD family secretion protein [Candidatus Eisenbacteria bacterium]
MRPEPLKEAPRLEEAPRVPRQRRGRKGLLAILAGVVALALILLGVRFWLSSRTHEGTDDAQVVGHIIPVLSRASGYVRTVLVSENQEVRAGDVLVQLDDRDLTARLRQAEANLTLAQTETGPSGEAAADVAAARASVAQARAEAERTANRAARSRDLLAQNAIARQDVENDEAAARAAAAALRAAQSRTEAAVAGARGSSAKVAAAIAERDEAALQASYARITAPHDGIVSKKSVEVGQLVQPGQALLAVVPLDSVWVIANFKETQIDDMKPGDAARIHADTYQGREFRGHVESLSPATGATFSLLPPENATGNFVKVVQRVPVKIAIDEPQDPAHLLRPGMSVHVSVRTQG